MTRTIDAASEKVYFLSVGLLFSGRASQPGSWRPWRGIEDLVNSEQRRRLTRLVNRFTKLLGEAGKHKNQLKKKRAEIGRLYPDYTQVPALATGSIMDRERTMKSPKAILLAIAVFALIHTAIAFTPGKVMNVIYVVMAWAFLIGILLVALGTIFQTDWGINLRPVTCPCCNQAFPKARKPRSLREALWGGGTCTNCGCEVDKWGRRITTSA